MTAGSAQLTACRGPSRRPRTTSGYGPSASASAAGTRHRLPPTPTQTNKENPMAHYNASLDTPRPPDEMFAYLSDFSSTQEWDPGAVSYTHLTLPTIYSV